MFKSLIHTVVASIAFLGSLLTLVIFADTYFGKLNDEGQIAVIFLGGISFYNLVVVLLYQLKWERKVRYAEVLPHINFGFSYVHQELRNQNADVDKIASSCERVCTQVAHAFSVITGTSCSVSIKVLVQDSMGSGDTKVKVITLSRDQQSASLRNYPSPVKHWIDDNTDFKFLLENISTPRGRYFFSNQLPYRADYKNTSSDLYGGEPHAKRIPGWHSLIRYWRWHLPYKSTIVVPICPASSSQRTQDKLIGYFCVDSPRMGAFKKQHDVDLMEGVADGLYNVISAYVKQLKENN